MFNVLLSCVGRRNYLLEPFRQALAGRGQVFAADSSADAAALPEADRAFLTPPVVAPNHLDFLLDICRRHSVRLLVSLNDHELPVLARHRERFEAIGTQPVVSSPEVIDRCFDKWKTVRFLHDHDIGTPRTCTTLASAREQIERGALQFPLILKPRWGTGSTGVEIVASLEELEWAHRLGTRRLLRGPLATAVNGGAESALLVQERLGGVEFGLDVVNDLQGEYVATFVRRKLSMRAGETDRAVTVHHPGLEALGRRLGTALRHVGNLDCDVFVEGDEIRVLELNPRFGGGYPFSQAAGANLPAVLVAWGMREPIDPEWLTYQPGVASAKCDRLVRLR